jgi:hypothetical protein
MPSKHAEGNTVLGWRNPPPELAGWVREESERSGDTISALLTEAVTDLRAKRAATTETTTGEKQ